MERVLLSSISAANSFIAEYKDATSGGFPLNPYDAFYTKLVDAAQARPHARSIIDTIFEASRFRFHLRLVDELHHSESAWFVSSNFEISGRWLVTKVYGQVETRKPDEFIDALRMIFQIAPISQYHPVTSVAAHCRCCLSSADFVKNELFH